MSAPTISAEALGLLPDELEPRGRGLAKIRLSALARLAGRPDGKLVAITGMTPTKGGEGKTTTAIGLADGLRRRGVRSAVTLRQPSLGPAFGLKGGGAGSGRSRLVPEAAIALHLTGDFHAVGIAHNLAAAFLDNHLHFGNALGIDLTQISWPRVVDLDDRALRHVVVGLGGKTGGVPRESEWHITAASEIMAILALATDLKDLRTRLGRVVVARTRQGDPITTENLRVTGPMTALLRDALEPNLLASAEGTPAIVHAGPFGNLAHGTSSVLGDRIARKLFDVVLTEAGFGADLGFEKFCDIKCRQAGLRPDAAVLVATVRAYGVHGSDNLARQIGNVGRFGVPCVVAVNAFPGDSAAALAEVKRAALGGGAAAAEITTAPADGGAGAEALADAVTAVAAGGAPKFALLYPDELPLIEKIERVAKEIYGAAGIAPSPAAQKMLADLEARGFGRLPVCIAKTHMSLSHDAALTGAPSGFTFPVREVRLLAGAGFVTAVAGDLSLMPALPSMPIGEKIDVDDEGNIVGLT